MKKLLAIIGLVVITVGAAWFFFRNGALDPALNNPQSLPFGSGEDINIPATTENQQPATSNNNFKENVSGESKILALYNEPVAGFVSFLRGTNTVVRFVDRATGHIFDLTLPTASATSSLEKVRVTNNTMPKIYEAHFRSDGSMVLLRSLIDDSDSIENTALILTPPKSASSTELYAIKINKLAGDIDSVLVGSGNALYYVSRNTTSIVSSTFTGTDSKTILKTGLRDWRLFRLGSAVAVYPRASATAVGHAYSLGNGLSKLVGDLRGLTAIGNSNGNRILYSYFDGGVKLFIKDLKKNISSEILPASLAEKCVWSAKKESVFFCGTPTISSDSNEPDSWYLGRTHFSDYVWKFDAASEISQLVSEPKAEFNLDLDVYEPKLTPNEDYLIFTNKRDLSLWAVKL